MECLEWCEIEMDVNKYYMVEVANILFCCAYEAWLLLLIGFEQLLQTMNGDNRRSLLLYIKTHVSEEDVHQLFECLEAITTNIKQTNHSSMAL